MTLIICRNCEEEKDKDTCFKPKRRICIECDRLRGRLYRQSERGKAKSKAWLEQNQDRMAELRARWFQENKAYVAEKNRLRYHSDPVYKLSKTCKRRIQLAFKDASLHKSERTVEYLGCSVPYLLEWFSRCFDEKMTIHNHGTYWHMDHVIPINTLDLTDPKQVRLCFSWFNLSPLIGSENCSKHDKIVSSQVRSHIRKLIEFVDRMMIADYIVLCARHLNIREVP